MHIRATSHVTGPGRAGAITAALALAMALAAAGNGEESGGAKAVGGAKNVVFLVGDGMGFNQIDAAALYQHGAAFSQVTVDPGAAGIERRPAEATQDYQHFPVAAAVTTYARGGGYDPRATWDTFGTVTEGATDSAAAATALATGQRTTNGSLGVDADGEPLTNLTERAAELGKATGVVTSVPFSHATPAGFVAHQRDRDDYHAIARQMIRDSEVDVVMGAGDPTRDDDGRERPRPEFTYIAEDDYRSLTDGDTRFELVRTRQEFQELATADDTPDQVFGLAPAGSTLQFERGGADRTKDGDPVPGARPYTAEPNPDVPTLAEMTGAALNVLGNASDEGIFLMVEGGAIDWAGHANELNRQIEEQIAFDEAVSTVVDWVERESDWGETLVVVTADHETGYLTGPGSDPRWTPLGGGKGELPEAAWNSTDHTNSLVPLYAKGPGATRLAHAATGEDPVRGAYLENTRIAGTVFDLWRAG
ncbi:alkaline phosphatase [Streptomyces otsuchiensis]|uniref:alkaline phosphatase n=1 Tax=Streptomyces otsuchiensis TaxID=2681388 RepID=UPI0010307755|nr:alkaline phosphatase [Streptomyces otsuchiensis]